jgi:hypothetical protein
VDLVLPPGQGDHVQLVGHPLVVVELAGCGEHFVSEQGVDVHRIAGVAGELVVCVLAEVGQELVVSDVQNYGQVVCVRPAVVGADRQVDQG